MNIAWLTQQINEFSGDLVRVNVDGTTYGELKNYIVSMDRLGDIYAERVKEITLTGVPVKCNPLLYEGEVEFVIKLLQAEED